jgi:RNA polymerase sigma factor (sigma-70 family)
MNAKQLWNQPSAPAMDFAALWKQHHRGLFSICLKLLGGNRADAEDALNHAALVAFRRFPLLEELDSPKAWLARVVRNTCIDLLRMRDRERAWRAEPREVSAPSELERQLDPGPNPEDSYLQREVMNQLCRALQAIPSHLREPLLQRAMTELSYSQMASQSPLTEVNLRKRVQEARRLLRKHIECQLAHGPRTSGPGHHETKLPEPGEVRQAQCTSDARDARFSS